MMNQTFVGCSLYHIYVSILMAYKAKRMGATSLLVIIADKVPDVDLLVPGLLDLKVFDNVVTIKSYSILDNFKKNLGTYNYLFNRKKGVCDLFERENKNLVLMDEFIKNSEINLFHIVRTRAYFLIKYPNNYFRMVEEGLGTYLHQMPLLRYLKRKYLIKFPILMGYDDQVKEVLVQFPEKLKNRILREKAVTLELKNLEKELSPVEKNNILKCFLGQGDGLATPNKFLILTQPLSEDKIIDEETKIAIYRKVVDSAKKRGYSVFIKSHPRELTRYEDLFPDVNFISRLFPIEVFNLSESLTFSAGLTVFSGSLDNLSGVGEKFFLGREILDNPASFLSRPLPFE